MLVIVPAFAVNVALIDPAGTVTDDGTVISALLLESVATVPPVGAAWLRVTVQVEEPPVVSDEGLQFRLLIPTGTPTVMLPPVALEAMLVPVDDAADTALTLIGTVPDALADRVTLIVASVPFWIVLAFNPLTMHVTVPLPVEH